MDSEKRLTKIRYLLETALDCDEEYLEEGAMGTYWPKSYANDAAEELRSLFKASEPTTAEINCCVEALANPERLKMGKSKRLLLQLRESSRSILNALSNSADPELRIFALETGKTSTNPVCFMPLYGSIVLEGQLLNDPDENVRIAAVLAVKQTIDHNAKYLRNNLQAGTDQPMVGLFYQLLTRLNDASANVRAVAAKALGDWAAYAGYSALNDLLERETDPKAREALASAKSLCAPAEEPIVEKQP